ncbi:MAG TPA: hypothetical protein DEF04_03855, partial [Clostridiales bacterium]|nr:hypothetical protein [Clostridiales bacterium]
FVIALITSLFLFHLYYKNLFSAKMVMGGKLYKQTFANEEYKIKNEKLDVEKYFRPSKCPVLNDKNLNIVISNYYGKEPSEINLPDILFKTPEYSIVNYFSILREAANPEKGKLAGCGTLGQSKVPYPVAYNFLSADYQEKLSYEQYLKTFENILYINLLKLIEVPVYNENKNILRYFVEIETIEGSDKDLAYFAYYYGFIDLVKEENKYLISDLEFYGENYLCAPYHGWSYDAEANVQIRYGGWCSLIKEMYPTEQEDFVKKVSFKGTDGNDYLIVFFQLTNDTDIEIAQYIRSEGQDWKLTRLSPEKCIKND